MKLKKTMICPYVTMNENFTEKVLRYFTNFFETLKPMLDFNYQSSDLFQPVASECNDVMYA